MPKYRIWWEIGQYGKSEEVIEAKNQEEAERAANDACLEEVESLISFGAKKVED